LVLVVATAIPASSAQASKIGPSSRVPRVARWSMHQQWSNPASSATRHTPRSWSIVAFWLSLSPYRMIAMVHSYPMAGPAAGAWSKRRGEPSRGSARDDPDAVAVRDDDFAARLLPVWGAGGIAHAADSLRMLSTAGIRAARLVHGPRSWVALLV